MALNFGAPLNVPMGKVAASRANRNRGSSRSPTSPESAVRGVSERHFRIPSIRKLAFTLQSVIRLHVAGYWVEKGRATDAISETLLSGRLSELLRGVHAVGDDLKFIPAAGGGAGSPTLFIPKWKG